MTKLADKIQSLKEQYPTLTKGINDEIFTLSSDEYEATIKSWAENEIAAEELKAQEIALRQTKISAYEKLGLSIEEIKALVPEEKSLGLLLS